MKNEFFGRKFEKKDDFEKFDNDKRKESVITIATVETYIDNEEVEDEKNVDKAESVEIQPLQKKAAESRDDEKTCLQFYYKHYQHWFKLLIFLLAAIGLFICFLSYKIKIFSLQYIGISLIIFSFCIILLKTILHLTDARAREKVLPYSGFRYQTAQGFLSKEEIFRRASGIKGSSKPVPGPNHFF